MRVSVTEKDIADGGLRNSALCPVSLAIIDAWRKHYPSLLLVSIEVSPRVVLRYRDRDGTLHRTDVRAPDSVVTFFLAFDDGRPVYPFAFELPEPCDVAA